MGSTQGNIVVTRFNGERVERSLMPPLLFVEAPLQSVVFVLMDLIQCCGWSKGLELPCMLKCRLSDCSFAESKRYGYCISGSL
jgi:hypothetical protein